MNKIHFCQSIPPLSHKWNPLINLRLISFARNQHIWSNAIYFLVGSVHIKISKEHDDCVLSFFICWGLCHPGILEVLHSFRLHRHLILFSSYKQTTVCSTSGRRIWGISSSCLNTRGICRPTFSGFYDTRSTSLQSGPLHLSPDQAEISEPAEPVVPCPALDGFSASLVSGSGTGLH